MNPLQWRKMTWLILVFSALMVAWAYSSTRTETCSEYAIGSPDREWCEAGATIGTGIGLGLLFCIWFVGFIVLSIIWFMARGGANRAQRLCPVCGTQTKPGETVCRKCGHDYALAATMQRPTIPVIETTGRLSSSVPSLPISQSLRKCPHCGETEIPESGRFCPSCGGSLSQ